MASVVLVAPSSGLPDVAQTASAGVRDLAFVGMGASLLLARRGRMHRLGHREWAQGNAFDTEHECGVFDVTAFRLEVAV